ncbi:MAG: fimbrillin family protein [Proteiniphilum sp.]|jgi:hypothetical protein|nr:fimbrillin family protein [Proteiniphilum sp.]
METVKKGKILVLGAALVYAAMFTSCNMNDDIQDETNPPQAVCFSAGIAGQAVQNGAPGTRAAGDAWAANDAIGIFMVGNGTTTIAENAANKQYTTAGTSAFTAVPGDEIYYPMDGSAVSFIAYYPWKTGNTLTGNISVDVSGAQDATKQAAIDLLWSDNAKNFSKASTGNVALEFKHKLSKIVMNCTADASVGAPLTGMSVTIKGMNTKNTLKPEDGSLGTANTPAAITPRTITNGSKYDAIVLPGSYAADGVTVEFTVGSDTFTWKLPAAAAKFEAGNEYTYEVTLKRTGITVTGTINPWITVGNNRTGTAE